MPSTQDCSADLIRKDAEAWKNLFEAYKQVCAEYPSDGTELKVLQAYERIFPERDDDGDCGVSLCEPKIIPDALKGDDLKAYETLLSENCPDINLNQKLYHVTTLSHFLEAQKAGGFFLAQPRTWSVKWEDTPFKNLLDKIEKNEVGKSEDKEINMSLVDVYQRSTFGMCWTLDKVNDDVIEMERRKHPGEAIVVLSTTARDLLKAYYRDRSSRIRCYLLKMKYLKRKKLLDVDVDLSDIADPNFGTLEHIESDTMTHDKFSGQNEVRLIVEDCPEDLDKTYDIRKDVRKKTARVLMAKHIDIFATVKEVDIYPAGVMNSIPLYLNGKTSTLLTFHDDN